MFKKIGNYFGLYVCGVCISGGFVLLSNEMFYKTTIKKLFVDKNFTKGDWTKVKPVGVIGSSAKEAFLSPEHSLKDILPMEESRDYNNYLYKKKAEAQLNEQEMEALRKNIFNNKV